MLDPVGLEDLNPLFCLLYALMSEADVLKNALVISLSFLKALLVSVHTLLDLHCPIFGCLGAL